VDRASVVPAAESRVWELELELARTRQDLKSAVDELDATADALASRDEVLAWVAHDLRNPVHTILLSATVLLDAAPKEERRRSAGQIGRIHRTADQMSRLIEDLLDVASLDAGGMPLVLGTCEMRDVCHEVVDLVATLAEEKGVDLRISVPDDGCLLCCDQTRVLQAFSNVLGNAIRFAPPGGTISITGRATPGRALFEIRDPGPGVPPSDLAHLFDRYWQGASERRKGRGLGLYVARKIVEAHGGRIWAESVVEEGTMVSFTVPLEQPAGEDAAGA
jgi:signal transduction histidine kinase